MGISGTRTHLGCHPDGLHEFLGRGAHAQGGLRVALDAIRALGHVGNGDRNDLLCLGGSARGANATLLKAVTRLIGG